MAESRRLRSRLNSYGVSGLLAYGLLNTLYYTLGFLIVWLYFAKVPRGQLIANLEWIRCLHMLSAWCSLAPS